MQSSPFFTGIGQSFRLIPFVSIVATLISPAVAQEPEDPVDKIVVTGVRTTEDLTEVPSATIVIRREQIESQNDASVADLMRNLPGVHVVQPSGQGGVTRIFLRGGDQNLTMVLLDGVRVNDPNDTRGSAFDFSLINLTDIERVEIVRGPQSAVYGSDSLAGVINIISKDRTENFGGSASAEIGTDDYLQAGIDFGGPIGEGGGFFIRAASKDDGEPIEQTTFESDSVSASLSLADDRWDVRFFGNYVDGEGTSFGEDSGGAELAVLRTVDTRSSKDTRMGLNGSARASSKWKINYLATWYDHEGSYFSPGVAPGVRDPVPPNGGDSTLKRSDIAVNAVVEINEAFTATVGLDYYDEDGSSEGFVEFAPGFNVPADFDFDRSVYGAFGEVHYKIESGPLLLASVRRDEPSEESGETTSKLGILYDLDNDKTSIRANWGQGFSLPGFFSLASPLVGNPDLLPETSVSYDFGVSHQFADGRVSASASLFHSEFKNLIDFESSVFMMINRELLTIDGVEMQLDWSVNPSLRLSVQATHLDLKLKNSSSELRQRPDWRGGLAMQWAPTDKWSVDAAWVYVGETYDTSIPTGDVYLDGYNRLDLAATYKIGDKIRMQLSLDNLLDEDYYEAIGFPGAGIRTRVGIRYQF